MNKRMRAAILIVICLFLTAAAIAQDGRIVRETVYSPSLEGNLPGDSPNRQVTIYLPPSYDDGLDMAYPVVYLLHGYTGNNELWMGGSYIGAANLINSMSSWLKNGKVREMILVMPNSYNRLGGSYYTNSPTTGNWADFIARDLVQYIDGNYRTLPQRESRAVIGHSMGGDGGIRLGMLYPQVFGCMGGMAGDYDFLDYWIPTYSSSFAYASTVEDWKQFSNANFATKWCLAVCAAWAPNLDNPPLYCDSPYVYTDTIPRKIVKVQEVFDKFAQHDIINILDGCIDALLNMKAIYVDCGTSDESIVTARTLHQKLNDLGVNHIYREFSGNHTCCVMTSTGDALEVFSEAMPFEMLVGVESAGKLATTWGEIRRGQ